MSIEDEIVRRILDWYEKHGRSYPWRRTRDPYRVLIAEMMLQRTRSDQVASTYERFLERFPDPRALAGSEPAEVERLLHSLGLQWRARKVWEMGRALVERFNGVVPDSYEKLLSLPGVGPYVAAAVLCFAYGRSIPVIDANVCRVVSRLFGLRPAGEARRDGKIIGRIYELHAHVPPDKCRQYTWGILDLGAAICRPKKPLCARCPLNHVCRYAAVRLKPSM
ncbi:MAG: A/G-specific adenine glycosylase [Nitrososphaerota archaeon]